MQWLFLNSTVHSCLFMSKRSCEAAESIEDAVHDNRMAHVNCIVLECICQVITQVPLGSDPVGFLDAGSWQSEPIRTGMEVLATFFQKSAYG